MIVLDYEYYRDEYGGMRGEEIEPYLKSSMTLICGCVSGYDEETMKYAACIQADHEMDERYSSVKLGDFSADMKQGNEGLICAAARMYLDGSGLMYRGIG